MQRSSIYTKCPGCGDTTLIQELQGSYVCAACGYDYVQKLGSDEAALERWAVDTMRSGVGGQLAVVYLYGRITKLPNAQAVERIKGIASKHGIDLPTGPPMNPMKILFAVIGTLVLVVVMALVVSRK